MYSFLFVVLIVVWAYGMMHSMNALDCETLAGLFSSLCIGGFLALPFAYYWYVLY